MEAHLTSPCQDEPALLFSRQGGMNNSSDGPIDPEIAEALWASITSNMRFAESSLHLAHYTTVENALKILTTCELWARDTLTFDPRHGEEHRQAFTLEALDWSRKVGPSPSLELRKELRNQLLTPSLAVQAFAACFSSEMDSSHMWRRYGAEGTGAALIIDSHNVNPAAPILAAPCIYDLMFQRDVLADLFECGDRLAAASTRREQGTAIVTGIVALMNFVGQAYKIPTLSDERESRYVYLEYEGQVHPSLMTPKASFRAMPLKGHGRGSPFVELVLGPLTSGADLDRVRQTLAETDHAGLTVRTSRVTL